MFSFLLLSPIKNHHGENKGLQNTTFYLPDNKPRDTKGYFHTAVIMEDYAVWPNENEVDSWGGGSTVELIGTNEQLL